MWSVADHLPYTRYLAGAKSLRLVVTAAVLSGLATPTRADVVYEMYTTRASFEARLSDDVAVIDFDDIPTPAAAPVGFDADRYEETTGALILSATEEGQYASQSFGFPLDFPPVSEPNVYAPGPVAVQTGTNTTTFVTFSTPAGPAAISGFGVFFIDADFPQLGPSSIALFDEESMLLFDSGTISGSNASQIFRGIVAVDDVSGRPTPAIWTVRLISGCEWPTVDICEGVVLDDFVFSRVPEPSAAAGTFAVLAALCMLRRHRGLPHSSSGRRC